MDLWPIATKEVKKRISALYSMLVEHDGYGVLHIDFKILKKGQKEISSIAASGIAMWLKAPCAV